MSKNLEMLYRQVIMDHYKNPRNKGLLEDKGNYHEVHYDNPSCGDDLTIQVLFENGVISDIKQEGTGCSISMSSASVMTEALIGKTEEEATNIMNNFYKMIVQEAFDEDLDMGDAIAYQGVSKFPARIKCATLAWKAFEQALSEKE